MQYKGLGYLRLCVTTCYPINNSNLNKINKMRYKTEIIIIIIIIITIIIIIIIIIIITIIIVITIPMVLKYQTGL